MEHTATAVTTIAEARGVTRDFRSGGGIVHALRGIDLRAYSPENSSPCAAAQGQARQRCSMS